MFGGCCLSHSQSINWQFSATFPWSSWHPRRLERIPPGPAWRTAPAMTVRSCCTGCVVDDQCIVQGTMVFTFFQMVLHVFFFSNVFTPNWGVSGNYIVPFIQFWNKTCAQTELRSVSLTSAWSIVPVQPSCAMNINKYTYVYIINPLESNLTNETRPENPLTPNVQPLWLYYAFSKKAWDPSP